MANLTACALMIRTPPPGYKPEGWTPPATDSNKKELSIFVNL